ncbi:MAG: alpha/beta hydrolase [Bifidobacteriaceae bacterium]|jgi:pimeloyl-ACP methyl ester carboxylesterase|nr:alpha/beta hydrolase [Bifidobacteriaceae bacterium]
MYVKIDGLNVHYDLKTPSGVPETDDITAKSEVIFLLHGWGSDLNAFAHISDVISSAYTAISLDLPGFGMSDEPKFAETDDGARKVWGVQEYANFVQKFIKHFRAKKVTLIGHSFGGRVIIKLLGDDTPNSRLGFTVKRAVLIDSAGILPEKTFTDKMNVQIYKSVKRFFALPAVKTVFPQLLEQYTRGKGSYDYQNATGVMRDVLVKTVNEDLTPLLPNITQPTLLIWGENDTDTPLHDAQVMKETIPNAGLVIIQGAGHFSFVEQPIVFEKVIREFLELST